MLNGIRSVHVLIIITFVPNIDCAHSVCGKILHAVRNMVFFELFFDIFHDFCFVLSPHILFSQFHSSKKRQDMCY